ncbi:MAG: acyl carrier protein [Firmicutes bacterium]|nr:acyl carrier protein [Candidatus Alectryobacillus merdavium]
MDKVQEIINEMKEKYEIKDLNLNASLTDLQIDSLDVVEFLLSLEDKYNITFEAEEMQDLKTASDLIELIKKKVK